MGLETTSSLTMQDGGTSTSTYHRIYQYRKNIDIDEIIIIVDNYTSKAKRTASLAYKTGVINIPQQIVLPCTMAELSASVDMGSVVYPKLKIYLEDLGHTVVDEV